MGIFSRLQDIINSNINAILDKAEDPDKIIRMVIQEMEDTLVEVRSSAARTIAEQKEMKRRITRLGRVAADWEQKAELAISKGREDLARGALIEKSKVGEMIAELEEDQKALTDALTRHEDDVIKLEGKLREARAKKQSLSARHKTAKNQLRVKRNLHDNRITEAFERFEKVEQRLDRVEGQAEAYELGNGQTLAEEIAGLEAGEAVEAELDALKQKLAPTAEKEAAPVKEVKK